MSDVYFNDYKKRRDKRDSKYDTSDIPLTKSERDFQDRLNQEKYNQIISKQKQNSNPYNLTKTSDYPERLDYNKPQNRRSRQSDYNYNPNIKQHNQRSNNQNRATTKKQPPVRNDYDNNVYSNSRNNPNNAANNTKKKKHKGCGCSATILCFILIIAVLSGGTVGYIYSLCGKTNYVKSTENTYVSSSDLMSSPDVYNILLLGTDEDEYGTSRSDTMMLVSLDKKNKQIKFTSFLRDMWVDIPEHDSAKLNASFAYGGAQLVMDTIEYNFKIDIDNYVMVNFQMFEKLIDSLGGVTVDITEAEASFINRTSHAKVKAGTNTLNGDYALIYCRIRKLDSDFMRTQRQRKVMSAILEQVKSQSIFKTAEAMTSVLPLVTTDIEQIKLTKLAISSVSLLSYGNDQMQIPEDNKYSSESIYGQAALVPNLEENRQDLQNFIYGK